MKRLFLPIFIIIVIVVAGGIYYFLKNHKSNSPEQENPPIAGDEITREEIMADLPSKIADISPAKPVLGGDWYITRFWFIQGVNKDFYTEYEDGHIMARILIETGKKNGNLDYKIVAYFEPGENDWVLKQGEDKFFGKSLDLYEHNEELEKWVKKN